MLSETVRADIRKGDIGMQLGEIAKANPEVAIGSYPFFDPQHGANTNVVLRAGNAQTLAQANRERHRHRVRPLQDQPAPRVKAGGEAAHTISTARRMRLPWLR